MPQEAVNLACGPRLLFGPGTRSEVMRVLLVFPEGPLDGAPIAGDAGFAKSFISLDAKRLRTSLQRTFEARKQRPLPEVLPPPPADRAPAYRKLAVEVGLDRDLRTGHAEAAALVNAALAGRDRGHWSPDRSAWVEDRVG